MVPGDLAIGINVAKVAKSHRKYLAIIDCGSDELFISARTAFQVVYPVGSVILDTGMDSVLASLWAAITTQLKRRDRLLQGMGFAATMGIVAILIHSVVDFNLQIPANAALFVVLLALAWICRYWDPQAGSG